MIQAGALVLWNPPDLNVIFRPESAFRFSNMVPVPGIMKLIDGTAGLMSYMDRGLKAEVPVLLSEVVPVRRHAA